MLRCENIRKSLGGKQVLKDINLSLHAGQISILMGPSGSGKSTLVRALSLLAPPDEGTVTIGDKQYRCESGRHTGVPPWPDLTIVFQQLFLWPHLSLRMNVILPIMKRDGKNAEAIADELLEQFGLSSIASRYPNQVSGGQRQLTAICRALALKPSILLLDEITSSLDIEHISRLTRHLKRLRDEGTTILIVTHLLGFAQRSGDKIIFIDHGNILEEGGAEILNTPRTSRLRAFLDVARDAS